MKLKTESLLALFVAGVFFASCDVLNDHSDLAPDHQTVQADMDDLVFQLSVEPAQIKPDEEITAVYSIRNNRPEIC